MAIPNIGGLNSAVGNPNISPTNPLTKAIAPPRNRISLSRASATGKTGGIARTTLRNTAPTVSANKTSEKSIHATHENLISLTMSEVEKLTDTDTAKADQIKALLEKTKTNQELPSLRLNPAAPERILYRGLRPNQLAAMLVGGSAGGQPVNKETGKPSEEAARAQVGEGESLPEFTTNLSIASQFGRGNIVAAFAIPNGNLTEGSGSESGLICNKDAPCRLVAWKAGEALPYSAPSESTGGNLTNRVVVLPFSENPLQDGS